jgi:hypothetical protein
MSDPFPVGCRIVRIRTFNSARVILREKWQHHGTVIGHVSRGKTKGWLIVRFDGRDSEQSLPPERCRLEGAK